MNWLWCGVAGSGVAGFIGRGVVLCGGVGVGELVGVGWVGEVRSETRRSYH